MYSRQHSVEMRVEIPMIVYYQVLSAQSQEDMVACLQWAKLGKVPPQTCEYGFLRLVLPSGGISSQWRTWWCVCTGCSMVIQGWIWTLYQDNLSFHCLQFLCSHHLECRHWVLRESDSREAYRDRCVILEWEHYHTMCIWMCVTVGEERTIVILIWMKIWEKYVIQWSSYI